MVSEELGALYDWPELTEVEKWREGPVTSKVVRFEEVTDISYSRVLSSNFSSAFSVEKDVIVDCESEVHVTNDLFDSLSITDRYLEEVIEFFECLEGSEEYWVTEDVMGATMKEETRRNENTKKMKEETRRNEKTEKTKEEMRRNDKTAAMKEMTRRNEKTEKTKKRQEQMR